MPGQIRRFLFALILSPYFVYCLPSVAPDPIPCLKNLELYFFDEIIVSEALSLYGIRQEIWLPVTQRLRGKNLNVPLLMKEKTAYMVPNPLEYPMQKDAVAKILKDVLYEVFMENMVFYRIDRQPTANFIFDYIFTQQMPLFIRCFGEKARDLQPVFD